MGLKKELLAEIARLEAEVADARQHQAGAQRAAAERAQERDAERRRVHEYEQRDAANLARQRAEAERKRRADEAEARRKNLGDLRLGIVSLKGAGVSIHHDKDGKSATIELPLDDEQADALSNYLNLDRRGRERPNLLSNRLWELALQNLTGPSILNHIVGRV